jgi:hypothetical protein
LAIRDCRLKIHGFSIVDWRLASLTFGSWNHTGEWLTRIEAIRRAA